MQTNLSMLIRFLAVAGLISGLSAYFTGRQLARAFAPGHPGLMVAWALGILLWLLPVLRMVFFREQPQPQLQNFTFFLMGWAATAMVGLLAYKLVEGGLTWSRWNLPAWGPWAVLGLALAASLLGWHSARQSPVVREVSLPIAGLKAGLEGLRIVQLSDIHVDPTTPPRRMEALVEQVQGLKPDLIALTGDLVDGLPGKLVAEIAPLAGFKAPLGVFVVTGNHEYYWDARAWQLRFSELGFQVLANAHRVVKRGGATLKIVGLNDYTATRVDPSAAPNLAAALAGSAATDFTLLLAHQPPAAALAQEAKADLFLAGHTHGGQFYPFPPIVSLFHKHFKGLYREGKLWIFIHSGSGTWGPPNRLGVPPEIVVLTLKRA